MYPLHSRRHYVYPAHRFISEGVAGAVFSHLTKRDMARQKYATRRYRARPTTHAPHRRLHMSLKGAARRHGVHQRKSVHKGQPKSYSRNESRGQASNAVETDAVVGSGSGRCSVVVNAHRSKMVEYNGHVKYMDNYAVPHQGSALGGYMYCQTICSVGNYGQWVTSSGLGSTDALESNVAWKFMQVNAKTTGGGDSTISATTGKTNISDRVYLASAEIIVDSTNESNWPMTLTYHVVTPKRHTPNTALFTWQASLTDDNAGTTQLYPVSGTSFSGASGNQIFANYTPYVSGVPDYGNTMPYSRPSDCKGYKAQYKTLATKTIKLGPAATYRFTTKAVMNQMYEGEVWAQTSGEEFRKGSLQVFVTATGSPVHDTSANASYTFSGVAPLHLVTRRLSFHPVKFNEKYSIEAAQINVSFGSIVANLKGENLNTITNAIVETTD